MGKKASTEKMSTEPSANLLEKVKTQVCLFTCIE